MYRIKLFFKYVCQKVFFLWNRICFSFSLHRRGEKNNLVVPIKFKKYISKIKYIIVLISLFSSFYTWSETVPNIEIFDSAFIEDNIHSGYAVTNNHKKKLVYLILGEDAISKNNEFNTYKKQQDAYEQELKVIFAEIKGDKDFMISQKDPYNFFISKKEVPANIDEIISNQIIKIKNLEMRDAILKYQNLSEITKPGGDVSKVKEVLMKTIDGISSDAEQLVKSHISQFSNLDENWIEKGFGAVTENKDRCPFCGSNIKELSLIFTLSSHKKFYFNNLLINQYKNLIPVL